MPNVYENATERDLIGELTRLSVNSPKASMVLMALTDDGWFDAVSELRRRYNRRAVDAFSTVQETMPTRTPGRMIGAEAVYLDRQRWNAFFYGRRLTLSKVGPMIGRCDGWGSLTGFKGRTSLQAMEELAVALDMSLDDLVYAVGTESERERVGLLK